MASVADLVSLAQSGLLLAAALSLPVVAAMAAVGLLTALLQAATQIQDASLSHLPRLLAAVVVLALLGPWMGRQLVTFTLRVLAAR